jgi:hypothetical protein
MRTPGLSPAAIAWLAGVAALGFRWASPLSGFYENAILADVLFGVAALLVVAEIVTRRRRPEWRPWHGWLAAYVVWTGVAAVAAPDRETALKTLLLVTELAVLAVITAWLASSGRNARALARVVLAVVAVTFGLAVVALALFYAGHRTGLLGAYGEQFQPSGRYARIRLGFSSPPLLASWCIAASAILAWRAGGLPRRWQVLGQIALAVIVLMTFSRGVLAFGAALAIRWAAGSPTPARKAAAAAVVAAVVAVLAVLSVGRLHLEPTRPSSISYEVPDPGNRREAAVTSWRTLRAHPLLGSGPGSYPGFNRGLPFRAHLTPLNVAATTGIPALLLLIGMSVAIWRQRVRPTDIAIWSGLIGLMLDGLAQDVDHFRHVWLMIGLAAVTGGVGRLSRSVMSVEAPIRSRSGSVP